MYSKRTIVLLIITLMSVFHQAKAVDVEKAQVTELKKYNLSVCTLFKDEARYLKEWIEYHRLIGVDHFYLYNNGSKDRYYSVLAKYIKEGIVTLIHWPDLMNSDRDEDAFMWALSTQVPAYENAAREVALHETKWLAFIDINEFLIPTQSYSLNEVLTRYDDFPGVTMRSTYYDASKIDVVPRKILLIETLEMTSAPELNIQKSVEKTIFKPDQLFYFTWPPYKCYFKNEKEAALVSSQEMRINQYTNRYMGYLTFGKPKEKLDIDNRLLTHYELSELLQIGYEINDQERLIYRYVPEMLKRLKM